MFAATHAEAGSRILDVRQFAAMVRSLENANAPEAPLCKGLIFVQLYAVYEYSIHAAVRSMLNSIQRDSLAPSDLHVSSLTLVLDAAFNSIADSGRTRTWPKRLDLMARLNDTEVMPVVNDAAFPTDGSHYRAGQLETIWAIFGLTAPIVPEPRLIGRIGELVDHRNAIAHGRERPEHIGRRYSVADIEARIDDVEKIITHLVSVLETHYKAGGLRR